MLLSCYRISWKLTSTPSREEEGKLIPKNKNSVKKYIKQLTLTWSSRSLIPACTSFGLWFFLNSSQFSYCVFLTDCWCRVNHLRWIIAGKDHWTAINSIKWSPVRHGAIDCHRNRRLHLHYLIAGMLWRVAIEHLSARDLLNFDDVFGADSGHARMLHLLVHRRYTDGFGGEL